MQVESSAQEQVLESELVDRILSEFGLSKRPTVDFDGLKELYTAWCHNVPFDNLRKLIHVTQENPAPLPGDNALDFFNAWLAHRTGGTCWSANGALQALLHSLGFPAVRGVATMLVVPDLPPNHGTVLVEMDGSRYMVDASIQHELPIQLDLDDPASLEHFRWKLRLRHTDNKWHIWWQPLHMLEGLECRLDSFPATHAEFQERHEMTRGWSPFNYELQTRKIDGDKTIGIGRGMWVELSTNGESTSKEVDFEERQKLLIERLGYSEEIVGKLPADRPTPPPPGSKTAQRASEESCR